MYSISVCCVCRAHFQEAQKAWKEYGILSELYVIIIDEIDAICKPRGEGGVDGGRGECCV